MDRLHAMNVFVAVAEEQGFAAAARRLDLSPPAVTRAIAALEDRLGVKLLNRTTRYVRATDAGQRYLEDVRRVLAEADAADEAVSGIDADPRGHVSITAPVMFGRMFVMPGIVEYLENYPGTEVSAVFLDRVVNLLEEGLDIGVRIGELPDSSMRAIRVGSVRLVTCASAKYLRLRGTPDKPDDLLEHSLIVSSAGSGQFGWKFESRQGARQLNLRPRLSVTSNDAAIEAALRDFGITRLLSYQIASHINSGKLEIVLQDFEPAAMPIHIVHREGHLASAKLRSCIDFLTERLRGDVYLNPVN